MHRLRSPCCFFDCDSALSSPHSLSFLLPSHCAMSHLSRRCSAQPSLSSSSLLLFHLSVLFLLLLLCCSPIVHTRRIDDCCCDAETVDEANDGLLTARLNGLRQTPFFRTFKVNLGNSCPFWTDDGQCMLRGCAVCGQCEPDEVESIWGKPAVDTVAAAATSTPSRAASFGQSSASPSAFPASAFASALSTSASSSSSGSPPLVSRVNTGSLGPHFAEWTDDDDCLWIVQDADTPESSVSYINLQLNPESYTGYGGPAAHEVWRAIYDENCFSSGHMEQLCYEQRVFYRLLSGMHAAISAHIANAYPVSADIDPHADINEQPSLYGPSVAVYDEKLGNHPDRLNNLYFAFVFLLRAVNKATPMLLDFNYTTHSAVVDAQTAAAVRELLTNGLVTACNASASFDESTMFTSLDKLTLKRQFKAHFRNLSAILDCIGCEKCRLHAKLQVLGIGTALKILFNDRPFQLQRNEVVALINTLAKLSQALKIGKEMDERRTWAMRRRLGQRAVVIGAMVCVLAMTRLRWKKRKPNEKAKTS